MCPCCVAVNHPRVVECLVAFAIGVVWCVLVFPKLPLLTLYLFRSLSKIRPWPASLAREDKRRESRKQRTENR